MEINRDFTRVLTDRVYEQLQTMQIVLGPRQVGKTTGVEQIFNKWQGGKIWASADLPSPHDSEWIIGEWNKARALKGDVLLVFDEIQKISRWSDVVKHLFDTDRKSKRLRVVLLGSASLSLSAGLNETLAGRFEIIDVPHWSYGESKEAFNWSLEEYITFGGYPGPAEFISNPNRWQRFLRDSIIEPVLSRDILGVTAVRKPALFRQTLELALRYPSQVISYQKLLGKLQDAGNVTTIRHYLELFQAAFIIKLVPQFSRSKIREKSSSPKIIPLAPALLSAFQDPNEVQNDPVWRGRVIEAIVGERLISDFRDISYWSKRNNEVDFVVQDGKQIFAIEVKSGVKRRSSGIAAFLREHPKAIPMTIHEGNLEDFLTKGLSRGGS